MSYYIELDGEVVASPKTKREADAARRRLRKRVGPGHKITVKWSRRGGGRRPHAKRRRNPTDFSQALINTGIAAAVGGAIGFAGRSVLGGASGGTAYAIAAGAGWATGLTALGALIVALADKPKREVGLETAGVSFGTSLLLGIVSTVAFTNVAVANLQPAPAAAQLPASTAPSTTV